MKMNIKELKALKKSVENEKVKITRIEEKISKLRDTLRENCKCPKSCAVLSEEYNTGCYYNRAYTEHVKTCSLCGKTEMIKRVDRDHYG